MAPDEIQHWREWRRSRRLEYRRDHFTKYGMVYGLGTIWMLASLAGFFVIESWETGGITGVLATGCYIWPTAREVQLGSDETGQVTARKSSVLDGGDVMTPSVSEPPDETTMQSEAG